MNELVKVFENNEFGKIRIVMIGNEPYAVGKDVAEALGYSNPQKAIRDHVDEEDRTVNESFTVNGTMPILINESGIISLALLSKLPSAKPYRRWVTSEVLPTIRKTGSYSVKQAPAIDTVKQMRAEAMLRNSRVRQAKLLQELAQSAVTDTAKQIIVVQAANTVAGEKILSLPRANERATITASELCKRYHLKETWATALGRKLNERLERNEDTGYNTQTVSERTHKEVKQWNWYVDKIIPVMDEMQENGVFDGHYEG